MAGFIKGNWSLSTMYSQDWWLLTVPFPFPNFSSEYGVMTSVSRNIPATSCCVPQVVSGFVVDGVNQPAKPPSTPLKVLPLLGLLHPSTLLNTFIPTYLSRGTWAQGNGLTQYFSSSLSNIYQVFPISQVRCQWLGFSGELAYMAPPLRSLPGTFFCSGLTLPQ